MRFEGTTNINSDGFLACIPRMSDHQLNFLAQALKSGPKDVRAYYALVRELILEEMGRRVVNELRG